MRSVSSMPNSRSSTGWPPRRSPITTWLDPRRAGSSARFCELLLAVGTDRRHHAEDLADLPGFDVAEELLRQLTRAQRFTPPAASAGRRPRLRLIPGSTR